LNYSDTICAAVCIGNSVSRKAVVEKFSANHNISFPNIIADDIICADSIHLGQGNIICYSAILTVNITIGNFVIINLDCTIGHDAHLDDFVTLYPSVNVSGNVSVGTLTEIGTGTNIIQGKSIGESVIVGAGAVVIHDIPSHCTAVGVPTRLIQETS
jgi:sugar O-acyltransferase (sialic acid O-acetyltransferase NeuD family)